MDIDRWLGLAEAIRSPRQTLRAIVSLPFMIGGIVVVLVIALAAIVVSATIAFVLAGAAGYLLTALGFGAATGAAFGIVLVLGTLVPSIAVTVWAYRRLPQRLRNGLEPGAPGAGSVGSAGSTAARQSLLGQLLRTASSVVGFALGVAYAYGVGVFVGDGSLWMAELPLVAGAIGAGVVAARNRSRAVENAAGGYLTACVLFGLLFLGAG